jgi:signal transduction histidine kinase
LYAVCIVLILWRVARAGLLAALVVGGAGWTLERTRFGASDADAVARIEDELRHRFDRSADTLGVVAARVATERDAIRAAPRDSAAQRRLFDAADAALPDDEAGRTGITVYAAGADGQALAWAGRVSDLPRDRREGPSALFVAQSAIGPRLVRIEPVVDVDRPQSPRLATIVVEQVLGRAEGASAPPDTFIVATSIVPARVSALFGGAVPPPDPYRFVIPSAGGGLLVAADVAPGDLASARALWRSATWAAVWSVVAVTVLLCSGPILEWRARARDRGAFAAATTALAVTLAAARLVFWFGLAPIVGRHTPASPFDLLLDALLAASLVWLTLDTIERCRIAKPRPRLLPASMPAFAAAALAYGATGAAGTVILYAYERFLELVVAGTSQDLLHFSLHPINAPRIAVAFGLLLMHASVIWSVAALARLPSLLARTPRQMFPHLIVSTAWAGGVIAAAVALHMRAPATPISPILIAAGVAGACAGVVAWLRGQARRASQAARLSALFLALLVPALGMYPSLLALAIAAKERLIANDFAQQAVHQRDDLQTRLYASLDEIDALPSLTDLVASAPEGVTATSDLAFRVWSRTDLAAHRLTSAVELYGANDQLVSRFATHELNLPEYGTSRHHAARCAWDLVEEVSPFGSSQRPVLRASRGICEGAGSLGAIVVRVMLDPRTLPFISSQSPYLESIRPAGDLPAESAPGRDVEFVVYGWSRTPIYAGTTSVWLLPDDVFQRLVESRDPFWTTVTRADERFRVYFLNDRGGIYALGYPMLTWFGHLVNLAELVALAVVLYLVLLGGGTIFNALTSRTPASGRALLREIRSSFYRKLFIAFVAAAVAPVVILAVATRTYFAKQALDGVDASAARTAAVAQRLVEDYATLQQRGPGALQTLDDQVMVLVGRAINQDVNLFNGDTLQATSERDLFASGLLTTRTPGDVYRNIMLDRLPTFVAEEADEFSYLLAAAPVRAGREGIVTVPVTSRKREIERQIDELDRRVLFAAILFSVLGAAIGYWMAERIADPVNRLTRATRRIARGDLDARIAATSSDELRRLVEDFNRMADDLKRQRKDVERTQRLEAWADMARQVAHDIKNPLTPIQLSAEHARRVNIDRGRPLSPVLDDCVNAILRQVALLRQISSEFSSFASSPTPRPERTHLADLIEDVVESYRTGLTGRISIDVDTAQDVPDVTIDRTLFARALTNVIENALHAMPGQGRLTIVTRRGPADRAVAVQVQVRDTGVGMDPESIAKIFEPYFSTKATGTGLGLTIAKRNVELNGGTIDVTSQRGVGTTVTMTLKLA